MKRLFNLALLVWLFSNPVLARHIVGGVLTYRCLGNGDYEFTMKVYRDCNCTDCAEFDNPAPIAIYECGGNINCNNLDQSDPIRTFNVRLGTTSYIPPPDYPCLEEPNICVQEGIYTWRLSQFNVSLPQSTNSYYIVYQRCCRNITINNLVNPRDQGATYAVEITPNAQRLCNNSPVFDNFPPTVVCANQPLNFDHSATDADGDQLVYEFCSPLQGGGPLLSGTAYTACGGASPTPPCPPPFPNVNFIIPTYSGQAPMGGNPVVKIDPTTGLITGVPDIRGQFVVGVCVTEYRNGIALSRVFRDFQFNVEDCDPTVIGRIKADEVIDGKNFIIRSCGDPVVQIENQSFQRQFIENFRWEFNMEGGSQIFTDWSPQITFPDTGTYTGNLYLNEMLPCGDTSQVTIQIYPAVEADFSFEYDTCVAGPVKFTDMSVAPSGRIDEWAWQFGDGNASAEQNPEHIYLIPGQLPVTLKVIDKNKCEDERFQTITYFPVPKLIVIAPSSANGCQPLEVILSNLSYPIDETYQIEWELGDDNSSGEISPVVTYETPGTFTVTVKITSPIGCETDTVFNSLISVEPSPIAAFDYEPKELSSFQKKVDFFDQSIDAARWRWTFDDGFNTTLRNPSYVFADTGVHKVELIVTHPSGCRDTALAFLDVIPQIRYYLPNAFTPNNDSKNEFFKGVGVMEGAQEFRFSIWNRWGELIFETNDPEEGWNGRKFNTGEPAPNGVYIVIVTFKGPRGEPFSYQGNATLIR